MSFKVATTDRAPLPTSAYSQVVRFGDLVVTSGYLGTAPDGSGLIPGGLEPELRQAITNIEAVLEAAGSSLDSVIRTTVYMIDISHFDEMNAIYAEYFSEPYPCRSTVGVAQLWGGAQVSLDVWAIAK